MPRPDARWDTLLRIARGFAVEADPSRLVQYLLREAVSLSRADGGSVRRWDEAHNQLVLGWKTRSGLGYEGSLPLGQGAGGLAALRRAPVVMNDYQAASAAFPAFVDHGLRAAVAAPLLHENRLLGVVSLFSRRPRRRFTTRDAENLEVLAGLAAATLVGLERARLEGVLLAARTAEHELNNQLTLTVGYSELLAADPRLLPELAGFAEEIVRSAYGAAEALRVLRQVTHIEEQDFGPPVGTTLDLKRALEPVAT